MSQEANPCLSLAINRLTTVSQEHFAIWIVQAPYSGGYVHHDCIWTPELTQKWLAWQEMFQLQPEPHIPVIHSSETSIIPSLIEFSQTSGGSYGVRLMQEFGISLWQWLFDGPIRGSLAQSRGIAIGQNKCLRIRLDIRDPKLICLPWEIMQPDLGRQAISLNQQVLFSRTTSDVDPLTANHLQDELSILLVLGNPQPEIITGFPHNLQLQQEANTLTQVIQQGSLAGVTLNPSTATVATKVDCLVQPTASELVQTLETKRYNVLFYGGHGITGPDGGLLFINGTTTINGTEFAQVLVRNRIILAVFNACWGAKPDRQGTETLAKSSLAEVLIHHGVPAVLAMRDSIADQEALSFIKFFTQALCQRLPVDQSVAIARQQLLTLYKFNQPAWTLPILYMHPEFEGELIPSINEGITELPTILPHRGHNISLPVAYLRSLDHQHQIWQIRGGLMRVGRRLENDLVIQERWVSQHHAEIICREVTENDPKPSYFLRDFSRFGTLIHLQSGWQKIHHQEIALQSGVQLKFGSTYGQTLEFIIEIE
jgi:hypothetical protein